MDQITEEGFVRAYRRGLLIWFGLVVVAAATMIIGGMLVEVTPDGGTFIDPYLYAAIPGLLAFAAPIVNLMFKATAKGCAVSLLQVAITLLAAYASTEALHEIEFRRTRPCWGVHSMDPGSGAGCPEGMREDFTREQLAEWYRKQSPER